MTTKKAGELISENMRTLYLWSLHKTSDPYKAEDLCSDIILAVLKSAPNLKCDDAFFGFVWKVAANTYKHYLRKNSGHISAELDEEIPDGSDFEDDLCEKEQENILRRELAFLSEKYRLCTVAYYYERMPIKDIAEKYGLTAQTVKFNLFQSRKILKEGIAMERQFGEKSFNPQPFKFMAISMGDNNDEFINLFQRKIPGQILLSAYQEPQTIEQLSVELGVASVYLEDEVRTLEKYGFIVKRGEKKYQTNLLIFSKEYFDEMFGMLDKKYSAELRRILDSVRAKLPELRRIGFAGCDLSDDLLLWDFMTPLIIVGLSLNDKGGNFTGIGRNFAVSCYALGCEDSDKKYNCTSYSGTYSTVNGHTGTKINYKGHRAHEWAFFETDDAVSGKYFPALTGEESDKVVEILAKESEDFNEMTKGIASDQIAVLKDHTPEALLDLVDAYCPHITLWDSIGWFGAAAVNTGALEMPSKDDFTGIIAYKK